MCKEELAPKDHVEKLKQELSVYYDSPRFPKAKNMGELLRASFMHLLKHSNAIRENHQ
jgi:hypothetical protein